MPNHSTFGRGLLEADSTTALSFSTLVQSLEGPADEHVDALTDATIFTGPLVSAANDSGYVSERALPCTEVVVYDVGQVCVRYVVQCQLSFDDVDDISDRQQATLYNTLTDFA